MKSPSHPSQMAINLNYSSASLARNLVLAINRRRTSPGCLSVSSFEWLRCHSTRQRGGYATTTTRKEYPRTPDLFDSTHEEMGELFDSSDYSTPLVDSFYHSPPLVEENFLKDFSCCGQKIHGLHDLLWHYEVKHAQYYNSHGQKEASFSPAAWGTVAERPRELLALREILASRADAIIRILRVAHPQFVALEEMDTIGNLYSLPYPCPRLM